MIAAVAEEAVSSPPPVLGGEQEDEEGERTPKKLAFDTGGDSADEAKDDELEEEVDLDNVPLSTW